MSVSARPLRVATGAALAALLIASSAPAAGATVAVESTTECPTAADVAAQIERFVPPETPMGYRLILSAGSSPESLQVSLLDRGGDVVRQRTTPLLETCAALAEEIAVLAATWIGELPAPEVRVLDAAPVQPPVAPAATAPVLAESVHDDAQPEPGQSGLAISAGAGVSTPATFWIAPALTVRALWHARGGDAPFLAAGLFANLPRAQTFAEGTPSEFQDYWYRLRITAAAGYRWQSGRFHLSLEAPVTIEIDGRSVDGASTLHGLDFDALGLDALERVGISPRDSMLAAGDCVADRPRTVLEAVRAGIRAAKRALA